MAKIIIYIIAIGLTVAMAWVWFGTGKANSVEQFSDAEEINIIVNDEEVTIGYVYKKLERANLMTATVEENNCHWCLTNLQPSQCLTFCDIIID